MLDPVTACGQIGIAAAMLPEVGHRLLDRGGGVGAAGVVGVVGRIGDHHSGGDQLAVAPRRVEVGEGIDAGRAGCGG